MRRATIETLTVNYRTPQQLMDLAVAVLRAAGVAVSEPTSARSTPWAPQLSRVADVVAAVPAAVAGVGAATRTRRTPLPAQGSQRDPQDAVGTQ